MWDWLIGVIMCSCGRCVMGVKLYVVLNVVDFGDGIVVGVKWMCWFILLGKLIVFMGCVSFWESYCR